MPFDINDIKNLPPQPIWVMWVLSGLIIGFVIFIIHALIKEHKAYRKSHPKQNDERILKHILKAEKEINKAQQGISDEGYKTEQMILKIISNEIKDVKESFERGTIYIPKPHHKTFGNTLQNNIKH